MKASQMQSAANSFNYLLFRRIFKNALELEAECITSCMEDFLNCFNNTSEKELECLKILAIEELEEGEYIKNKTIARKKLITFFKDQFGLEQQEPVTQWYLSLIDVTDINEICGFCDQNCRDSGCKGSIEEWENGWNEEDEICGMSEVAYKCPSCAKGIINPTFNGELACDKCTYNISWQDFNRTVAGSKEYQEHCKKAGGR